MANAKCCYCKGTIPEGARFCAICKHHQNSWDQFWSEVRLQDLMGVMSVGALAITSVIAGTVNANSWKPHAVIKASTLACSTGGVKVALSNVGNRTAFIGNGFVAFNVSDQAFGSSRMTPEKELSLKAGETQPVKFVVSDPVAPLATEEERQSCSLGFVFTWVEPGSEGHQVKGACRCKEVGS
jgi:hypothetical protein